MDEDRRIVRTRQLISQALHQLMLEKRYDKITIQDIIDRANVGRSTFYSHYESKDDLLISDFERVLDLLNQHFDTSPPGQPGRIDIAAVFSHIQENYDLYQAVVWGRGIDLIYEKGQLYLRQEIETLLGSHLPADHQPSVPLPVLADFAAGALLNLIRWWLEQDMPYSPAEMDRMYHQMVLPGVQAGLGVSLPAD